MLKKRKRRRRKKKKEVQSVEITQWDYCHACITVVEQFNRAVEDTASREFRMSEDKNINGNKIADDLCNGTYYENYSDKMKWGCMKLLQDHYEAIIGGFRGTRNAGERNVDWNINVKVAWRPKHVLAIWLINWCLTNYHKNKM